MLTRNFQVKGTFVIKIYENSYQGQRLRSCVTEIYQLLIISFTVKRRYRTQRQTDSWQTDTQTPLRTIPSSLSVAVTQAVG